MAVLIEIEYFFFFQMQGRCFVNTSCFCSNKKAKGKPVKLFSPGIFWRIMSITFLAHLLISSDFLKFYQANGGFIMSASHNPGGPEYDWGIKVTFFYSYSNA